MQPCRTLVALPLRHLGAATSARRPARLPLRANSIRWSGHPCKSMQRHGTGRSRLESLPMMVLDARRNLDHLRAAGAVESGFPTSRTASSLPPNYSRPRACRHRPSRRRGTRLQKSLTMACIITCCPFPTSMAPLCVTLETSGITTTSLAKFCALLLRAL